MTVCQKSFASMYHTAHSYVLYSKFMICLDCFLHVKRKMTSENEKSKNICTIFRVTNRLSPSQKCINKEKAN